MSIFKDKTLLITGGTGSFGNAVLRRFLNTDIREIRIFSRDEKKQDDMRHEYQVRFPEVAHKIKFFIGDVRSLESCRSAMPGVDYIFHAAALKQVPSCEFFPMEAVKTNVIGTDNVLTAAIEAGVEAVICLSTDKAAYPINAILFQTPLCRHRCQTLVPQDNREAAPLFQHGLEFLCLLAALAFCIIHILWKSQHNLLHLVLLCQALDPG